MAKQTLDAALLHAIGMERRAATRVKRAATVLHKWQARRRRIERRIGEAEVQRILNSQEAFAEITKKKNTVRRTLKRLTDAGVLPAENPTGVKQGFMRFLRRAI